MASMAPSSIVRGKPKSNILPGMRQFFLNTLRFALAASTNRNNASVRSISNLPLPKLTEGLNHSRPSGPSATPTATNTIGPDNDKLSTFSEIRL